VSYYAGPGNFGVSTGFRTLDIVEEGIITHPTFPKTFIQIVQTGVTYAFFEFPEFLDT
jgi:hypothetical protein